MLTNVLDAVAGGFFYYLFSFEMAFGIPSSVFIGRQFFGLKGIPGQGFDYSFFLHQWCFAIAAPRITSGSIAERTQFVFNLNYSSFPTGFVYPVVSHWFWSTDGWGPSGPPFVQFRGYRFPRLQHRSLGRSYCWLMGCLHRRTANWQGLAGMASTGLLPHHPQGLRRKRIFLRAMECGRKNNGHDDSGWVYCRAHHSLWKEGVDWLQQARRKGQIPQPIGGSAASRLLWCLGNIFTPLFAKRQYVNELYAGNPGRPYGLSMGGGVKLLAAHIVQILVTVGWVTATMVSLFFMIHWLRLLRILAEEELARMDLASHGGYVYEYEDVDGDRKPGARYIQQHV
ncbi:hypothetical protein U1Q18_044976 [Sarracenia purpurea var. burkii]